MPTIQLPRGPAVHYEDLGSGDPVLLVHGITESGEAWAPVTERLAGRARLVVVDLPGHGRSSTAASYDVADLAGAVSVVAASLGLDRPRVVGHSLGGFVAAALASVLPARSIVCIDQPLELHDFQVALRSVEEQLRDPDLCAPVVESILDGMAGEALPAAEHARLQELRRIDPDVVVGVWSVLLEAPADELAEQVAEVAASITCPFLSLHGSEPGLDYETWLTGLVPSATLEVWDGHGHYPHLVNPGRFVERLETFWSTDDVR